MPEVDVNLVHVLVGALVPMVVGFVWYSKAMFANTWMKLSGLKESDIKGGPGVGYLLTYLGAIVQAYVLTHVLSYVGADTAMAGAVTGFWMSAGFVVPTFAADFIFGMKSRTLYWITVGYYSVSLMLMGAVLAAWQ